MTTPYSLVFKVSERVCMRVCTCVQTNECMHNNMHQLSVPRSVTPQQPVSSPPKPVVAPVPRPTPVATGKDHTEAIRGMRKAMVKTMMQANAIPHFGLSDEICVDAVMELRATMKPIAAERGVRFSLMPIFIKVRHGCML